MPIQTLSVNGDHEVLMFAAQELRRYYQAVTGEQLTFADQGDIVLILDAALDGELDEYAVRVDDGRITIAGGQARAVLYGVYAFCDRVLGVRFLRPDYEWVPRRSAADLTVTPFSAKAHFAERALNTTRRQLPIDAIAKMGYNTVRLSVGVWESTKEVLLPELRKRGLQVSVSGHILGAFVPPEAYFEAHPDWFALYDGARNPEQYCFSHPGFIETLCMKVAAFCRDNPDLYSMTLMFQDNAFKCTCDACRKAGFMHTYLHVLECVQAYLTAQGITIPVFHIAYNAGFAWDMLEQVPEYNRNNGMVACWGRNYTYAVPDAQEENDRRFRRAFEAWGEQLASVHKRYAIYEYYADYWMMGTLLPPLGHVIERDLPYFKQLGVCALQPLDFDFVESLDTFRLVTQDLEVPAVRHLEYNTEDQIAWLNLYITGRQMWTSATSYEQQLADYTQAAFGGAATEAAAFLEAAEAALAPLTRFAAALFKLRVTDVWFRDDFSMKATERIRVHAWDPQDDNRALTREARDACRQAHAALSAVGPELSAARGLLPGLPRQQAENLRDLLGCARYLSDKTKALAQQYDAQLAIEDGRTADAASSLREALALEESYDGMDCEHCRTWLARCEAAEG